MSLSSIPASDSASNYAHETSPPDDASPNLCSVRLISTNDPARALFRIPPEVFCEVFRIYRDAELDHAPNVPLPHPPWVYVTSVCSYWRNIALGDASLWTRLTCRRPDWMHAFIERSSGLPLDVDLQLRMPVLHDEEWDAAAVALAQHMDRIRTLRLLSSGFLDTLAAHLLHSAPRLESLTLDWKHEHLKLQDQLDSRLLARAAPRLHTLRLLHGCVALDAASPLFANLTHLELSHGAIGPTGTISDILSALAGAPRLEALTLHGLLPPGRNLLLLLTPTAPVALPHLRALDIADLGVACEFLLQHIARPADAALTLHATALWIVPLHTDGTLPQRQRSALMVGCLAAHAPRSAPARTLRIAKYTRAQERLPGSTHGLELSSERFVLRFEVDAHGAPALRHHVLLHAAGGALPLAGIDALHVDLESPVPAHVWFGVLSAMPRLGTVSFRGASSFEFLEALAGLAVVPNGEHVVRWGTEGTEEPACAREPRVESPALQRIELAFAQKKKDILAAPERLQRLLVALCERRQVGGGLRALRLINCNITTSEMRLLNSRVPGLEIGLFETKSTGPKRPRATLLFNACTDP